MSHLGERLTALVDGELGHDERERALGHLTACEECRAQADALRRVKRRLSALSDVTPSDALMRRLHAMGEPGGPLPPPLRRLPGQARTPAVARPRDTRPARTRPRRPAAARRRVPRGRYLIVSAAALAVLGLGSAAFAAGSEPGSAPRVTPPVEQFAVEHALTSGDIPLTDPRAVRPAGAHP